MTLQKISAEALACFKALPTSILTDVMSRCGNIGAWIDGVHPLNESWKAVGRIRTLQYGPRSSSNQTAHSIYTFAETIEPGDVILLAALGNRGWLMGENIAHYCLNFDAAAVIADGYVRDKSELVGMDLPVFARGVSARPSSLDICVTAVDVPVIMGGAHIFPGDLVSADIDGVAVAPADWVERLALESTTMVQLEKEQEIAIRERQPYSVIQAINARKKIRVTQ